ncbi:hypothetical protein BC936DRAFT_144713 [Jimgerdemannia flammicorona]|uniref:Uncharacterized protein n=1 Tax=Jimgerdemannia flammicorona TaxID=994334 RepID=A0A433DBX8_9FUNG|nr:hypothetical protein BC936DRAFT_144713 [Jimgerdemannia flammicorona]
MQEFGSRNEAEILQNRKRFEACDLLCFVYDSSDVNSFSYIVNLRVCYTFCGALYMFWEMEGVDVYIPVARKPVFVAGQWHGQGDGGISALFVLQRYEVQPDVYCRNLGLAVPLSLSVKERQTADLYHILTGVAMNPTIATPGSKDAQAAAWTAKQYITLSAVAAGVLLASVLGYKLVRQQSATSTGAGSIPRRDYL